jgi:L-amino acid N-acyltransferase YncA
MTLRDAVEADLPAIVAIYNASIPGRMATADMEPVTVESRRLWFHQFTPDHFPLWVAECEGRIAGWLSFRMFYGRPAYAATAEVSVYIAPERHGQGVGRRLLTEAIRRSPALGLKTLLYMTFAHNTVSRRLAESLGFAGWGELPRVADLGGIECDLLILGRRVDSTLEIADPAADTE